MIATRTASLRDARIVRAVRRAYALAPVLGAVAPSNDTSGLHLVHAPRIA